MKYLIIIFVIATIAFSSCNNSKSSESFDKISWKSEKLSKYQLVRPINFNSKATDVYGLPIIKKEQWYLITNSSFQHLLPVYINGKNNQDFVEDVIRLNKIAILDTVDAGDVCYNSFGPSRFWGLNGVEKMEIICFKEGYFVTPVFTSTGQMTVVFQKK